MQHLRFRCSCSNYQIHAVSMSHHFGASKSFVRYWLKRIGIACFERSIYILLPNENKHNGSLIRYKYTWNTIDRVSNVSQCDSFDNCENKFAIVAAPTLSVNLKLIYREKCHSDIYPEAYCDRPPRPRGSERCRWKKTADSCFLVRDVVLKFHERLTARRNEIDRRRNRGKAAQSVRVRDWSSCGRSSRSNQSLQSIGCSVHRASLYERTCRPSIRPTPRERFTADHFHSTQKGRSRYRSRTTCQLVETFRFSIRFRRQGIPFSSGWTRRQFNSRQNRRVSRSHLVNRCDL